MSRHEGVSCDACKRSNFSGKRYKCLLCFDYDLCSACYMNGTSTTRHSINHPMQCIITRSDFELFFGGESTLLLDQHPSSYSFVCPHCGIMGLSEAQLLQHVSENHTNTSIDVICPICASMPRGEPNFVTDDLLNHLSVEHRVDSSNRETVEPISRNIRRLFHPTSRNMPAPRSRRAQLAANLSATSSAINSLASNATFSAARETIDPIGELLSQLSDVRRVAAQQQSAISASQLQLLQQKLQLERQQVQQARERLERLPRKQASASNSATSVTVVSKKTTKAAEQSEHNKYLLNQHCAKLEEVAAKNRNTELETLRGDFTRDLIYSLLTPELRNMSVDPPVEASEQNVTTELTVTVTSRVDNPAEGGGGTSSEAGPEHPDDDVVLPKKQCPFSMDSRSESRSEDGASIS